MKQTGLILFGHGARDPRWAEPFQRLQAMLTEQAADRCEVRLAYLELMTPSLENAVAELVAVGCASIVVVPVFFGQGGHLRRDFPVLMEACRALYPAISIQASAPVGEWPDVLQAIVAGSLQKVP